MHRSAAAGAGGGDRRARPLARASWSRWAASARRRARRRGRTVLRRPGARAAAGARARRSGAASPVPTRPSGSGSASTSPGNPRGLDRRPGRRPQGDRRGRVPACGFAYARLARLLAVVTSLLRASLCSSVGFFGAGPLPLQPGRRPRGGDQAHPRRRRRPAHDQRRGRPRLRRRAAAGRPQHRGSARRGVLAGAARDAARQGAHARRSGPWATAPTWRSSRPSSARWCRPTPSASRSARCCACSRAEMRIKRRQHAEEKAQQVPVKIMIPVVLCILPCLFVVIMGPAGISMMQNVLRRLASESMPSSQRLRRRRRGAIVRAARDRRARRCGTAGRRGTAGAARAGGVWTTRCVTATRRELRADARPTVEAAAVGVICALGMQRRRRSSPRSSCPRSTRPRSSACAPWSGPCSFELVAVVGLGLMWWHSPVDATSRASRSSPGRWPASA